MAPTPIDSDSLLADLEALDQSTVHGPTCSISRALAAADLTAATRAVVDQLLDRPDVSATDLCNVLVKHGIHVRAGNLARHRRRGTPNGCLCPRTTEATS